MVQRRHADAFARGTAFRTNLFGISGAAAIRHRRRAIFIGAKRSTGRTNQSFRHATYQSRRMRLRNQESIRPVLFSEFQAFRNWAKQLTTNRYKPAIEKTNFCFFSKTAYGRFCSKVGFIKILTNFAVRQNDNCLFSKIACFLISHKCGHVNQGHGDPGDLYPLHGNLFN